MSADPDWAVQRSAGSASRRVVCLALCVVAGLAAFAGGCAAAQRKPAVPAHLQDRAMVPSMLAACTWSDARTPPEFDIVAGMSTGALIAPPALLAPAHDDALRHSHTQLSAGDVLEQRSGLSGSLQDALVDGARLRKIVAEQMRVNTRRNLPRSVAPAGDTRAFTLVA